MSINLSDEQARVLGCLMEKSVTVPDQYPLTLNALTNACNQKSSRHPVMNLDPGKVGQTARELVSIHIVQEEENFKSGVRKYKHRFCNTPFSDYQFDSAQYAVICLMLLRGPQTPGELRANGGRLHSFADNSEVVRTLESLINHENGALVIQLPRTPGRKDSEYMHLLSGSIDTESYAEKAASERTERPTRESGHSQLLNRIEQLEIEVADLKSRLAKLESMP